MNILVGDLGGTKTNLAIVSNDTGPHDLKHEKTYASGQYDSLTDILRSYLQGVAVTVESACLAVAGPISNRRAAITNLTWVVDADELQSAFGFRFVRLINDLESVAYAVPILRPQDIHTLHEGSPVEGGPIAILAPGTGLGEAFMTADSLGLYRPHGSEGGHVSFAPTNALQVDLLTYMRVEKGFDHVSVERVCSGGLGFPNLYDFIRDTGRASEPAWLAEKLAAADDPTPVIIEAAKDHTQPCEIAVMTLDLFCDILAAEAGNLALKVLAWGGIYIGGGIPPRILDTLTKPGFLLTLWNKGRFEAMLTSMPVRVILNSKAALIGAAACGLQST